MKFSHLIDQFVRVQVGGNEYNGTITKVGEDFIMVDDEATGTVILSGDHVNSLSIGEVEVTALPEKKGKMSALDGHVLPNNFRSLLETLRQNVVRVEGVGMNAKLTLLLNILSDYVVLCTIPEGLTYMPILHVQSISPVDAYIQPEFSTWAKEYGDKVVHANSMLDLMKTYIGKSIRLSRDSPEEVSGILCNVDEHCAELITSPVSRAYIPLRHIKRMDTFLRVELVPFKDNHLWEEFT